MNAHHIEDNARIFSQFPQNSSLLYCRFRCRWSHILGHWTADKPAHGPDVWACDWKPHCACDAQIAQTLFREAVSLQLAALSLFPICSSPSYLRDLVGFCVAVSATYAADSGAFAQDRLEVSDIDHFCL